MHLLKRFFGWTEPTQTELSEPQAEISPNNDATARLIWDSIQNTAAIKVWATQLRTLTTETSTNHAWDMVGRAVIIEAQEEGDVLELMPQLADAANMQLRILSSEAVIHSFPSWFHDIENKTPTLLVLRAGQWCSEKYAEITPPARHLQLEEQQCSQFRSNLITLIQEELQDKQLVLVTVVSSGVQLDVSLRSAELFSRRIQMPNIPDHARAEAFFKTVGRENCAASLLEQPRKVSCLLRHEYPERRRRMLMIKAMQRLAYREARQLEFDDLIKFSSYGTCDTDMVEQDAELKRRNAIHEAGHALISHLTSREQTAPDFCSILPRDDSYGLVVSGFDSYERNNKDLTYKDMTHKLSVMLAGRAAEHLILGAEEVSAKGAVSDLENATKLASSMFALWGLSDDMSTGEKAGANLSVFIDEASASEAQHLEHMVRTFLQSIFLQTLEVLEKNRSYLNVLVETLMERQFLLQEDLLALHQTITKE